MRFVKPLPIAFVWLMILTLTACVTFAESYYDPNKEHHTKDGFRNPYIDADTKTIFDLYWTLLFGNDEWADYEAQRDRVPIIDRSTGLPVVEKDQATVTWLGHSTALIQYRDLTILTDPIFSSRSSPFSFAGPKRVTAPAVNIDQLPPIDIVLISHNHYDHLDQRSAQALGNDPLWVVPLNYKAWFEGVGVDNVVELDWWGKYNHSEIELVATPSQHWTGRGLFDRNKQLWASWVVRIDDFSFWFGGDTGYNNVQFNEIGKKLGPFDLAIIPIGAYAPRWFMKDMHVNPEEAMQIHRDVRSRFSIGVHWGTFPLTAEPIDEPPNRLAALATELTDSQFVSLAIGESIVVPR